MRRGRTPLLVLGVPLLLLAVRMVARLGAAFAPVGDLALIELSVINATRGRQLLGAYSRFGWDQVGPAWFYLAAPIYRLAGSDTRALFLAALVINAAAVAGIVAVVRHRAGSVAATWAAVAIGVWVVAVSPRVLISPWNPHAASLPLLLVLVLAAAAMTGSGWSLVGAAAAGSVVVQCHLGTAPVVAAVLLLATAGWLVRLRREVRPAPQPNPGGLTSRRRGLLVAGAVAGMLGLWIPTAIDQVAREPGNLVALGRFARDGFLDWPRTHPLSEAVSTVARTASMVPLGPGGSLHEPAGSSVARGVVAAVWAAAAAGAALVGWRRRRYFAAACAGATLAAGAAAVAGATRVVGGLLPYLTFFATILPAGVIVAWGSLATTCERRPARTARPAAIVGVVVACLTAWAALRTPLEPEGQSAAAAASVDLVSTVVPEPGDVPLMVRETDHRHWPHMAGVVRGLDRAGHDVKVDQELVPLVGESWGPGRKPRAEVIVGEPTDPVPPPVRPGGPESRHLGHIFGYSVWFRPLG